MDANFAATKTAIAANFAARQSYIMSEPEAIRETIEWVQFAQSVREVLGNECNSGLVHAFARELGLEG